MDRNMYVGTNRTTNGCCRLITTSGCIWKEEALDVTHQGYRIVIFRSTGSISFNSALTIWATAVLLYSMRALDE